MKLSTNLLLFITTACGSMLGTANADATCKNDDHFRFRNEWGLSRTCDWLKDDQARQHKYCDKNNEHGVTIDVACALSCNKCCKDDLAFTFVSDLGEAKSCDWLKDNNFRQHKYCSRECNGYPFIGDACPETCNWCPTSAPTEIPTAEPTIAPTKTPSTKPSPSSIVGCENNSHFRFVDKWGSHHSCDWLKGNQARQHEYCDETNADGIAIGVACAEACDRCSCEDDKSFTFINDYGERQPCDWLKGNYFIQHKYCPRECNGYPFVGNACPESCNWCPTSAPSAVPSAEPTVEPSTVPSALPSKAPSMKPSTKPSASPTSAPSDHPSGSPSTLPTSSPSKSPSSAPTSAPSSAPSTSPSSTPSAKPSLAPSASPSSTPSRSPSSNPSSAPSSAPTNVPSSQPSNAPSVGPTCLVDEFLGKTYFVPFSTEDGEDVCAKVQLFEHGIFSIDMNNPHCANGSFHDTKVCSVFDEYGGNKAVFKEGDFGLTGYFAMREDPHVSGVEFNVLSLDNVSNTFVINMLFPSCSAPSASPSYAPSASPSSVPSTSPSLSCDNDNHFTFEGEFGLHKNCDWLKGDVARQQEYCGKTNAHGMAIGIACANSCGSCSCEDDSGFSFLLDSGESKSCEWLKDDQFKQQKYCQRVCDGDYSFIGNACPESCNWCLVERRF